MQIYASLGFQILEKTHFEKIFKTEGLTFLESQINTIILYPTFINEENRSHVKDQLSLKVVQQALNQFEKEKFQAMMGGQLNSFTLF